MIRTTCSRGLIPAGGFSSNARFSSRRVIRRASSTFTSAWRRARWMSRTISLIRASSTWDAPSEVAGLLESHQILRAQLLPPLEPLEDHLRLALHADPALRAGLFFERLQPNPVDDLVVVVDLPDAIDVLPVLLVRGHLRL